MLSISYVYEIIEEKVRQDVETFVRRQNHQRPQLLRRGRQH